jgi:5'-phosphate synthase pdxT subunit
MEPRAGVLALQGSFEPHLRALERLGLEPAAVRSRSALEECSHLIVPGGESTTLHHLMNLFDLWDRIRERHAAGALSIFGTCAGAILLGREEAQRPPRLGLLDAHLDRNAYGRQIDSFTKEIELDGLGGPPMRCVFIRAPRFASVGPRARVLGRNGDEPIVVEGEGALAATFHPELSGDLRLHARFLNLPMPSARAIASV